MGKVLLPDDANQIFYSATKSANLMLLKTLRKALTVLNTSQLLPHPPKKTILIQTKSVSILTLVKSFSYQSCRQHFLMRN